MFTKSIAKVGRTLCFRVVLELLEIVVKKYCCLVLGLPKLKYMLQTYISRQAGGLSFSVYFTVAKSIVVQGARWSQVCAQENHVINSLTLKNVQMGQVWVPQSKSIMTNHPIMAGLGSTHKIWMRAAKFHCKPPGWTPHPPGPPHVCHSHAETWQPNSSSGCLKIDFPKTLCFMVFTRFVHSTDQNKVSIFFLFIFWRDTGNESQLL